MQVQESVGLGEQGPFWSEVFEEQGPLMLSVVSPLAEGHISHLELCFECWFVETG